MIRTENINTINKEQKYTTVIFDLDGTLLNTLDDLHASVNFALEKGNMSTRTLEEVRCFVGNGVMRLMELAVPEGKENPRFEEVFKSFKSHYSVHCNDRTRLYPYVEELLQKLKKRGYRMAIVSNKYYDAVQELKEQYFAEYIQIAIGEKADLARKPAPDTVMEALHLLGSTKEESVYVGDSEVDIATARNVGMDCIAVTWGFRTKEEQKKAGGKVFAADPLAILDLI